MSSPTAPILFSSNSSWNLVNFRAPIIKALVERGYRVAAAVPRDEEASALARRGVELHHIPMDAQGVSPFRDIKLLLAYEKLMRRLRPSAFLPFTVKPNLYGSIAAARRHIPTLNTITGLGTSFLSGRALKFIVTKIYRHALRRSQVVFFHNSDDRDLFVAMGLVTPAQARIVAGSGVDLRRFCPGSVAKDDPPVFLFLGRLLKDKGAKEFAQAAAMLGKSSDARFQMLGSVENHPKAVGKPELEPFISAGAIEILGEVADVRPFIERASCVVLPSYREGLPRSLLEASAMGKPIITTDVPGCRHAVDEGLTGFLCEARSAESLVAAIRKFLDVPADERREMGRRGRRKAEIEFSDEGVVSAYFEAFPEVREQSRGRSHSGDRGTSA